MTKICAYCEKRPVPPFLGRKYCRQECADGERVRRDREREKFALGKSLRIQFESKEQRGLMIEHLLVPNHDSVLDVLTEDNQCFYTILITEHVGPIMWEEIGETSLMIYKMTSFHLCHNCRIKPKGEHRNRYCDECHDKHCDKEGNLLIIRKQYYREYRARPEVVERRNRLQNKRLKVKRLAQKSDCLVCGEKIDELYQRNYHIKCNPRNQEKGVCKDCGVNKIGHGRNKYCDPCATDPEIVKERERMYGRRNYHKHKEEKYRVAALPPGEALVRRLRTAVRGVVRRYLAEGEIRVYGCFKHLPYTPVEFIDNLAEDWPDGFPKDMENYHIDHIIPINHYKLEGKLETMEGIIEAFALENLRLIPAFDNLSKGAKVIPCGE